MSLTLATVADALIEFILSLLRDPEVRAEFEDDPDAALASRGLSHVSPSDVQSVAPVIIERTQVVQVPVIIRQQAAPVEPRQSNSGHEHSNPVVREIHQVSQNFSWVDDRDTIVDQSVNQNIWAHGDVTQTFDNEAVVASGDEAVAGAGDIDIDKTTDQSTTIEAGEDVNIGNDTDVTVIDDSFDENTDTDTDTDASTDIDIDGSGNDHSTDTAVTDSGNEQTDSTVVTDVVSDVTTIDDSSDVIITDADGGDAYASDIDSGDAYASEAPVDESAEAPAADEQMAAETSEPIYTDSAAEYTEIGADSDESDAFTVTESTLDESATDDNF